MTFQIKNFQPHLFQINTLKFSKIHSTALLTFGLNNAAFAQTTTGGTIGTNSDRRTKTVGKTPNGKGKMKGQSIIQ